MSVMRPPPIEPFHPLLEDTKPLRCSTAFRFPNVTRSHPRHPHPAQCPRIPRSSVHEYRRRARARSQHPSYEAGSIAAVSRRRKRYPEQLPILRVYGCPEEVPRPLHLHLRLVNRSRSSAGAVSAVQRAALESCGTTAGLPHTTLHRRN